MWIFYALISAFGQATRFAVSKKLTKNFNSTVVTWQMIALSLPFVLLFTWQDLGSLPLNNPKFIISTIIASLCFTGGSLLMTKALEISPISATVPFLALTPLPAILIEFLILGTKPTIYGIIGIVIVVIGGYMLNESEREFGFWEPIKAIGRERGSVYAIITALIFAFGGILDKYGIGVAGPMPYLLIWTVSCTLVISFFLIKEKKSSKILDKINIKWTLLLGFLSFIANITFNLAATLTNASYVIAIKRTSAIFSVLIGWIIFKELKIKDRMLGTMIMVAGVAMIAMLG